MIIDVAVKPNSGKFSASLDGSILRVSLTEPAEKNRANLELVKTLAKLFNSPVRIISGAASKRKRLEIGLSETEFLSVLAKA